MSTTAPTTVRGTGLEPALRRRRLLRRGFWAGIGVLAAGGLASLIDFITPLAPDRIPGVFTVPAASVPQPGGQPYHHSEGKFWLVNLKRGRGSLGSRVTTSRAES